MFLRDFIGRCAATYPQEIAYISGSTQRRWSEVHERTHKLAGAIQHLGLRKGDACAILSHNNVEICEHWLACLKGGWPRVGVNWRYSKREALHVIRDTDARVVFIDAACVSLLADELDELRSEGRKLVGFGAGHDLPYDYETLIREDHGFEEPPLSEDDVALIGATSGSTGLPKGVLLTQRNVRESLYHQSLCMGYQYDDVRLYATNPAGVNIFLTCANILTGMKTIVQDYHDDTFLDLVQEYGVTQTSLIPTMMRRQVERIRAGHYNITSLRHILYGTMPTPPALIRAAYDALGCGLIQMYGLSESGGPVAALRDSDHRKALAGDAELLLSAGRVLPHAMVTVRDDAGRILPTGEMGTVWLGGETIMKGYVNLPGETAEALPEPGWVRSGDYGRIDERGYIFLGDRKKNMIISGGMNVHPISVENAIASHPAVSEVVVVGVPHPDWGEAVAAMVVLWPNAAATEAELIAHCRSQIPRWEIPKHVEIVSSLPIGFTNKLDKKAVKAALSASTNLPWKIEV